MRFFSYANGKMLIYMAGTGLILLVLFQTFNMLRYPVIPPSQGLLHVRPHLVTGDRASALQEVMEHLQIFPGDPSALLLKWRLGGPLSEAEKQMAAPLIRRWMLESRLDSPEEVLEIFIAAMMYSGYKDMQEVAEAAFNRVVMAETLQGSKFGIFSDFFSESHIRTGDMKVVSATGESDELKIFEIMLPFYGIVDTMEAVTDVIKLIKPGLSRSRTRKYRIYIRNRENRWQVERISSLPPGSG